MNGHGGRVLTVTIIVTLIVITIVNLLVIIYTAKSNRDRAQADIAICERGNILRAHFTRLAQLVGQPELAIPQAVCDP